MNATRLFFTLAIAISGLLQTGCSKRPEIVQETVQVSEPERRAARLRQIDAELAHWTPTGRPQDVERREALKRERALLAADLGYAPPAVVTAPAPGISQPAFEVQATPPVIVASDSSRHERRYQPMAPNSKWMDNHNQGRVYDRPILRRGSHIPWSEPNP